ncbi:MAG TPA: ABC transporter permease, partial [Candidatus Sulfopaludibacter sp.]|nr:ABC transporter permease [Candidatus Sulfopaludibacter sp.]
GTYSGVPVEVEGQTVRRDWADVMIRAASVTPGYFQTLGIALRAGRAFDVGDTAESEGVVIVNEAFVRKLIPDGNPVGRHVRQQNGKWMQIVGVIRDARYNGPAQPVEAEAYVPYTQDTYLLFVAIRTAAAADEGVLGAARGIIRRLDPQLPITQVRTMRYSLDTSTSVVREMMALLAGFALVTLLMSTLGLGGVMAYTVSQRRREIGLRMALGASAGDLSRAVIRSAARLIAAGAAAGVAGAFTGARVLQSLLYGVQPGDAAVLVCAPLALGAVALLACLLPAHRAATVDPMAALRQE